MIQNHPIHRKKLKHYNDPGHIHHLTFSCFNQKPLLKDQIACKILVDEISFVREKFRLKILAYVLMPDHVHILVRPRDDEYSIARILQALKGRSSKKYGDHLKTNMPEIYQGYCLLNGLKSGFHLWRPGGGYDRNLTSIDDLEGVIHYIEDNPVRAGLVEERKEWHLSSAFSRLQQKGLIPDEFGD